MGVVGSTANILDFIGRQVEAAQQLSFPSRIQVLLPFLSSHDALKGKKTGGARQ